MSRTEEQKIEFIENLYPAAKRVSDQTGMAWETILAQAAQETGWGEHVLSGTNNIFNIKADSSWKGETKTFNVREYDADGNVYYTDSKFRVYPSIDAAMEDRVKFLKENGRYADAGLFDEGVRGNLQAEANALKRAGYATDPNYAQSLVGVFNTSIMQEGIERAGGPRQNPLSDKMLTREERGDAVTELQQKLTAAGFSTKGVDGHFGQNTEDAVRAFQQAHNLDVDGKAGPMTLQALGMQPNPSPNPNPPSTDGDASWPAPGNFTINRADKPREGEGEFGTPRGDHRHGGIDIVGNVGDPIESMRPGTVIAVKPNNGDAGNMITIDHGGGLTTTYMHLDKIKVELGQQVTENTVIGTMGRSGNTPKEGDTHLHFETRENGVAVDPRKYLTFPGQAQNPNSPGSAMADGTLSSGEKGPEVERLQKQLNALGYTDASDRKLGEDGKYGKLTKEGVEQFQRENGLNPTGVADAATLKMVDSGMTRFAMKDDVLQSGERGPDVRNLQQTLADAGYKGADGKPLGVDGVYGDNTKTAVGAYQKANGLPETGVADKATLVKMGEIIAVETRESKLPTDQTTPTDQTPPTDKPLISNPNHPDHKLYQQAVSNLEQLGPSGGFKSREDLEKAAAAVAADAKATGLQSIDHVSKTNAPNGQSFLVATQGDPTSPASNRSYIDYGQAVSQTVAQSTGMADAKTPATQVAAQPVPQAEQPQQEPIKITNAR